MNPNKRPRKSLEVRGSLELQNGCLRALKEAWDDFLLETIPCQVWLFSVLLGRLQVAPRCQVPTQEFLEVRGSPVLQNGCLRDLGKACDEFPDWNALRFFLAATCGGRGL